MGSDIANRVVIGLRQKLPPGYDVAITGPLTIEVGPRGATSFRVHLDNIDRACVAEPNECDSRVSDFANKVAQFVANRTGPPSKARLRAVVRSADFVDELRRGMKGDGPVAAPFFGGLVELCYVDTPTAMGAATVSVVKSLGLTSDEALVLCKQNLESVLPPLQSQITIPGEHSLGVLRGDPYESSRILFHDDWSPVAAKLGGHLLVAVPASDIVLYGRDADAVAVKAMSNLARKMFDDAPHPVSTKVFRWTVTGWDIAAP